MILGPCLGLSDVYHISIDGIFYQQEEDFGKEYEPKAGTSYPAIQNKTMLKDAKTSPVVLLATPYRFI